MRIAPVFAVLVLLPACGKKQPAAQPEPVAVTPAPVDSSAIWEQRRRDSLARAADLERQAREAAARALTDQAMRDTLAIRIHFDFDRAELRPEARELLDRKVAILRANPGVAIRVAGHCDERGSDEYNLALGARRASAVRAYLSSYGIEAARVETVSFGEEQPMALGRNEEAWALNRRDEFAVRASSDQLRAP